jgi:glycosyltransferase involved in cell wall biosynthesis
MIQIIIANYKPEFNDGRVQRISGLEEYLISSNTKYEIISFGSKVSEGAWNKKLFSFVLRFFHSSNYLSSSKVLKGSFLASFRRFFKNILFKICIPDIFIFDVIFNYKNMQRRARDGAVAIISVPWFSTLLYSRVFKNNYLILDFRDLYLGNKTFETLPFFDKFLFKFSLSYADEIWVTTQSAKDSLELTVQTTINVVSNGVAPSVIAKVFSYTRKTYDDQKRPTIGYFGNLGGQRIFANFFNNLMNMKDIDLIGAGNFDERHSSIFGECYIGFLDKNELYKIMSSCDLIIVCITKQEHSDFAIPAKLYEALCFGFPIVLNAPPNSAAQRLLEDIGFPFLLADAVDDIDLVSLYELARNRADPVIFDRSDIFKKTLSCVLSSNDSVC